MYSSVIKHKVSAVEAFLGSQNAKSLQLQLKKRGQCLKLCEDRRSNLWHHDIFFTEEGIVCYTKFVGSTNGIDPEEIHKNLGPRTITAAEMLFRTNYCTINLVEKFTELDLQPLPDLSEYTTIQRAA